MEIKASTAKEIAQSISGRRRTYFINAGHRGAKTGAIGYIDEGAEAICLRQLIAAQLKQTGSVVITDDDKAQLSSVVKTINAKCTPDDVCIDLHFNASSNKEARGSECFVRVGSSKKERELAKEISSRIAAVLQTKDRGAKEDNQGAHTRLAMCRDINCTAVLIEVCFVTNPDEVGKYLNSRYAVAQAIVKSILNV